MIEEVNAFRTSGLPATKFCIDKPYTSHKLKYWASKLRGEQELEHSGSVEGFSRISVSGSTSLATAGVKAEIVCPNGIRIALYESLTANFLKSLL